MPHSAIVVHPHFDGIWPFAADRLHEIWKAQAQGPGPVSFVRLAHDDRRTLGEVVPDAREVQRLIALDVPAAARCAEEFPSLREYFSTRDFAHPRAKRHQLKSEGFWGQSVSEFALGLTISALRRIPQTHHAILTDLSPWEYDQPVERARPSGRGQQFGDDANFTSGTIAGKRVRIVGAGNIGSRYASFCHFLGADVAAWDPVASEPAFHRAGARRVLQIDQLVYDAEIFAPMLPLLDKTRGIVTAEHVNALPKGCLVVLVTRAGIVDMPTLRRRVLANELSLAADVFDVEPLPLDDPLLGRPNVVHTPHNAGRTIQANHEYARYIAELFVAVGR